MKLTRILIVLCLFALTVNFSAVGQEGPDPQAVRAAFAQALDGHNSEEYMSFFAEDAVWDWVSQPAPLVGHEQIGAAFAIQIAASPDDWRTDQGLVMSVDNLVVVEHAALGTQTGPLPVPGGAPPSGNEWVYPHLDIYEIEGDKIKRLTSYGDDAGVFVQWGLMPAPEMPELTPSFTLPDPEPTGLSPVEADIEEMVRYNSEDAVQYAKMFRADAQIFPSPLGTIIDRDAWIAMYEMTNAGFSDGITEVVRRIDLGDGWILAEMRMRSRHTGTYLGIPGSGHMIDLRGAYLSHFDADGLITHHNIYWDNLTLITQMTEAPYSPEGTWVVTVSTPAGNQTLLHTVGPEKKTGGSFSGIINLVNDNPTFFGMFPEVDDASDWITETVQAGRDKYKSTMMVYGTKKGEGPLSETVLISISHVTWTITGPDSNHGEALYCIYLAEQDVDGDGFPDEGQDPFYSATFSFTSRRFTVMTPPVPSP